MKVDMGVLQLEFSDGGDDAIPARLASAGEHDLPSSINMSVSVYC